MHSFQSVIPLRAVLAAMLAHGVFLLPPSSAATNVQLTNPGLEGTYLPVNTGSTSPITGMIASGWSDNSAWATPTLPTIQYSQVATNCHGGSSCQQITVTSAGSGRMQFVQTYPQQAGNIYTDSAWVRGTDGVQVSLAIQQAGSPYTTYVSGSIALSSTTWQQITAVGYITTTEPVQLMLAMSAPGTVVVDDFAVSYTPGSSAPTPNLGSIAPSFFGMHVANYLQGSLQNAGFEPPYTGVGLNNGISGQVAVNWYDNSSWASPTVTYSQDTSNPHGGTSSQKVAVASPGSGAVQLVQNVTVIPGQNYTFSAWVRGDSGMKIDLLIRQQSLPYTAYSGYVPFTLTSDWRQVSVTGTVGDTGDVLLMFYSSSAGTFWVDDVTFTNASGAPVSGGVPWPQSTFGQLRLWDSGTAWTALEPAKGVWNWAPLDAWVAAAEAHGVNEILLTLGQSPEWASSQPDNVNYVGAGAPAPPNDFQDWRDYITAVGQRYKGRIRNYEIWNEPNDPTYYAGTVPQLVELTKEAYTILKSIDPANTVVAPVPYDAGYLDQLLQTGMAPFIDVVAFHIYTYEQPPEQVVGPAITNVRFVMAKNGVSALPLWDTEGASGDTTTTEDVGAAWIVRRYLVDLAYGSVRYNWYTWSKGSTFCAATEETDPRQLTKAGLAFQLLQNWLRNASLTSVNIDGAGNWQIGLNLVGGSAALIVWNPTASTQFSIPGNIQAVTARDIFGGSTAVTGSTITVGANPLLLSSYNQPLPKIGSIVSAADRTGGIAPGGLGVVTGSGFASTPTVAGPAPLPAALGGASVFVNGVIAPLLYAGPDQAIFQMPSTTTPGSAAVFVNSPAGRSASAPVALTAAAPAVFQLAGRAVAMNADGEVNSSTNPARSGSNLLVYLTGIGPAAPEPTDGVPAPDAPAVATLSATATIGALNAPVQSLSLTPGLVGVAQAVLQVPTLTASDYQLIITVNGVPSAPATVSVGAAPAVPK
jgi:uncharacterized protein (TIGR03437 family)